MGVHVRPAVRSDIPALSAVLAEAFEDDPLMAWMLPDEATRADRLTKLFAAEARYHHLAGGGVEVATDDNGLIGGATLWDPPGRWKQSWISGLVSLPSMVRVFGRGLRHAAEVSSVLEGAHPNSPHWYLATVGTGSAARGGGYGKALLNSRLERCDREHVDAYLESSKESNIPYYNRFGFEVTHDIVMPGGGPTIYAMMRQPRGA
ncbi:MULTISPECIES: GNAT family N-acetyltransferase [Rhodococcus erythropolis group]|uniref:N-acetyltransferase n=1 Tax=Rhodococcus erythropolis TaxID=1833 RepID=A0A6G9CWY1_RHOER|nr:MULTISPECIES: GNAT family N-acetyltransferase [Rhodococcus erythropolis group]MCT6733107.1 GNAT family N-acetyltransferase [Rhodococcus qingshengii]MDJ0431092.1 GNAT family N-acetyltransferase [Rhodococcus qingshengii]QIP41216.1 N-acetyltransferase [Rhodococcus erythropolis]